MAEEAWAENLANVKQVAGELGWKIKNDEIDTLLHVQQLRESRNPIGNGESLTTLRAFHAGLHVMLLDVAKEYKAGAEASVIKQGLEDRLARYTSNYTYREQLQKTYPAFAEALRLAGDTLGVMAKNQKRQ